jgi:hypothetical protein
MKPARLTQDILWAFFFPLPMSQRAKRHADENEEEQAPAAKRANVEPQPPSQTIEFATVSAGDWRVRVTRQGRALLASLAQAPDAATTSVGVVALVSTLRSGMSTLVSRISPATHPVNQPVCRDRSQLYAHTRPIRGAHPDTGQPMTLLVLELSLDSMDDSPGDTLYGKAMLASLVRVLVSAVWVNTLGVLSKHQREQVLRLFQGCTPEIAPRGQQLQWVLRDWVCQFDPDFSAHELATNILGPDLCKYALACVPRPWHTDLNRIHWLLEESFVEATAALATTFRQKTPALTNLDGRMCTVAQLSATVDAAVDQIDDLLWAQKLSDEERTAIDAALAEHLLPDLVRTLVVPYMFILA